MKLLQKTLLPLALLMPSFAFAETVSNAEAEYMSGSLCTLSQRMAKDYLAIGADIRQEKASAIWMKPSQHLNSASSC